MESNCTRNSKGQFINQGNRIKFNCQFCGKEKEEYLSRIKDGRGKFCSHSCKAKSKIGELHPKWNPNANTKRIDGKQIFTYRLIAEKMINRPLSKTEVVHHINGDRKDNRTENLLILSDRSHRRLHYNENPLQYLECLERGRKTRWQSKILIKPKGKMINENE